MSDWVKVVPTDAVKPVVIEEDGQDDWMREEMIKKERLARMEMRRKE